MINYKLIDSGDGRRLEKFGSYLIDRPDPEVLWQKTLPKSSWDLADAKFVRTQKDKGEWETKANFPANWTVTYDNLQVLLKLSPFKHVGIFPEQEFEWDLISKLINKSQNVNVLNLFGYTGVASLVSLHAGAKVTHVDASRPAISWFVENIRLNKLEDKPVRFIPEDCLKFAEREVRRGVKYDGIIVDPPVYGHGPQGEIWSFSKDFPRLLDYLVKLLSDKPLFLIVNAYAVSTSATTLHNMLADKLNFLKGKITHGELSLTEESAGRLLSTGIYTIFNS